MFMNSRISVLTAATSVALLGMGLVATTNTAFASNTAPDGTGSWTQSIYKNSYGQRAYSVYVPKSLPKNHPVPLMVMLHGCSQSADVFAKSTRMNTYADQHGFVVLYPEQDSSSNSSRCWNWYLPDNFVRGGGELGIIVGMVDEVRKSVSIDPTRIGVAGLSAGAALTSNLIACHSDLFSVGVIDAGLEYKAASSMTEAFMAMSQSPSHDIKATAQDAARCAGSKAKIVNLLVVHGMSDTTVSPKNAARIIEQFSLVNDLLDDGQANGSQTTSAIHSETGQVQNGGRTYRVSTFGGNGKEHIREVLVDGMTHAWSGGASGGSFTDPAGPSSTDMAVQLLLLK
jgi:poly(hydroxyalkanoate) depolymerase family esterase